MKNKTSRIVALLLAIMANASRGNGMQVVERCLRSKIGACLDSCEDDCIVTPDYACVVDGATSPTGRRWTREDLTGGQWAARVLCSAVQRDLTPEMSASDIVATLTRSLQRAYDHEPDALEVVQNHPEERATASLVLYSKWLRQLILVGDCQTAFMQDGKIKRRFQPDRYVDTVTSQARAMFWQAERLAGEMNNSDGDAGRDLIHPLLIRQRRFQNNMKAPALYRYWAMDGFPIEEEGIEVLNVPDSVNEIILATDGYPCLFSTLNETEEHLQKLIREDPMMIDQYLAAKGVHEGAESFDDRTYLRIRLTDDTEERNR